MLWQKLAKIYRLWLRLNRRTIKCTLLHHVKYIYFERRKNVYEALKMCCAQTKNILLASTNIKSHPARVEFCISKNPASIVSIFTPIHRRKTNNNTL